MRRRLEVVLVGTTVVVVLAFVLPLALLVRDVARDRAMADADRDASALFPALAVDESLQHVEAAVARTVAGADGRLIVYLPDGTVIGPDLPASEEVMLARSEGRAWSGNVPGGAELITPVIHGDGTVDVVRVVIPSSELNEGVRSAWLSLFLVGGALIAASFVFASRVSRSITAPVAELAAASQLLASGELDARVAPAGPPEIIEVGQAFNHLAEQVSELLAAEREDLADLAHRLRTPLAALRLQLDQIDDDDTRGLLGQSADDLARSLDRVIHEARRRGEPETIRCDLVEVLSERAEFWSALAEEQARPVTIRIEPTSFPVQLSPDRLGDAFDVVLENVFAHTSEAVGYKVVLVASDEGVELVFTDEGPGFESFLAAERGVTTGSTGLGLDIARRAVEAAGGSLSTSTHAGGGARVVMRFPAI